MLSDPRVRMSGDQASNLEAEDEKQGQSKPGFRPPMLQMSHRDRHTDCTRNPWT